MHAAMVNDKYYIQFQFFKTKIKIVIQNFKSCLIIYQKCESKNYEFVVRSCCECDIDANVKKQFCRNIMM